MYIRCLDVVYESEGAEHVVDLMLVTLRADDDDSLGE